MPEQPTQTINRPGQQPQQAAPPSTARLDQLVGQIIAAQVGQRGVTMSDGTINAAVSMAKRVLAAIDGI